MQGHMAVSIFKESSMRSELLCEKIIDMFI